MRLFIFFLIFSVYCLVPAGLRAQESRVPDFSLGNVSYYNLNVGDRLRVFDTNLEVLGIDHNYTKLRVEHDTAWVKVARRSPAIQLQGIQVFVADNRYAATMSVDKRIHGLLKGDVLLGIAPAMTPLADPVIFGFPVSFTQGFLWRNLEDSYMFSYQAPQANQPGGETTWAGVGIDMRDSRGMERHMVLAMETGLISWVELKPQGSAEPRAVLCIQSESTPGIYYIYENLHSVGLNVKRGQRIMKGEGLGFAWGEGNWNHFRLGVVYSDTMPSILTRHHNTVNFYPQLLDLYFGRQPVFAHSFTKGQIYFGRANHLNGNEKNVSGFEEYHGTGWLLGRWNSVDKVEWVSGKRAGNARLRKTLFAGQPARCTNPSDFYEFEINVRNGAYRIRALVGDHLLPSWQKIEFEGVVAGTFRREAGDLVWTSERIVKVNDGKLTVRIYTNDDQVAGISEIVFQQAVL